MDGVEIMSSQPHAAATNPFLLSSPPVGHHHHQHHHATFNLQTVQLSFDACLTYNATSSLNLLPQATPPVPTANASAATRDTDHVLLTNSSTGLNSKPITTLTLTPQSQIVQQHHAKLHQDPTHHQHHQNPDKIGKPACQTDGNQDEKDKQGDLNTPVSTSSDLPSFFGPAALIEPPLITGKSYCSIVFLRLDELFSLKYAHVTKGRTFIITHFVPAGRKIAAARFMKI